MKPRCPSCTSTSLEALPAREAALRCRSCRARFARGQALVRIVEAEAYATEKSLCTCDERRGCPQCFRRAEALVGMKVRDRFGREWRVRSAGEKDRFPTIHGDVFWDLPDQVEIVGTT
jgi:hypothetical protein